MPENRYFQSEQKGTGDFIRDGWGIWHLLANDLPTMWNNSVQPIIDEWDNSPLGQIATQNIMVNDNYCRLELYNPANFAVEYNFYFLKCRYDNESITPADDYLSMITSAFGLTAPYSAYSLQYNPWQAPKFVQKYKIKRVKKIVLQPGGKRWIYLGFRNKMKNLNYQTVQTTVSKAWYPSLLCMQRTVPGVPPSSDPAAAPTHVHEGNTTMGDDEDVPQPLMLKVERYFRWRYSIPARAVFQASPDSNYAPDQVEVGNLGIRQQRHVNEISGNKVLGSIVQTEVVA